METRYDERLARLRRAMAQRDVRAMVISKPENRRYFSGFSGEDAGADSAGMLVVGPASLCLVTDRRYRDAAREDAPGLEVVTRQDHPAEAIAAVLKALDVYSVGFESEHLTDGNRRALDAQAGGAGALVPTTGLGDSLRAVKDDEEIALARHAAEVTDAAFAHVLALMQPGRRERDVAWELERYMRERGAESLAFPIQVAAGVHAAMPHAPLTDHVLAPGEPVVVDMGARVGGYCADMTRTVMIGGSAADSERFRRIYGIVLEAQERALSSIRPGMLGREADATARAFIEAAGHSEEFTHGLGHGVGLEIHEQPSLGRASDHVLAPGMLVTVEPGIYQAGWGGVRIEDLAVVRPHGLEVLSTSTKECLIIE
ncbi:MAG: Xaa-Pro peptidase family protein [Chloroflexota bacterium]